MLLRRALLALVGLFLVVVAGGIRPPTAVDAQHIGPGGALALAPGPKEVRGFVRVIDGDTLDVSIRDAQGQTQRVAVGLVGIQAPMGNTACGKEATQDLKALVKGGLRLEDDPTIALDGRNRVMYRAVSLDGRAIADELVRNGHGRWDGRGEQGQKLDQTETEARSAARGCVWEHGADQAPWNLQGPRLSELDKKSQRTLPGRNPVSSAAQTVAAAVVDLNLQDLIYTPIADAQGTGLLPQFTQDIVIASGFDQPTNFAFAPDGSVFVTEKPGRVRLIRDGALLPTPVLDISDRVNGYFDRGLLGIAVDPDFTNNGYIYLMWTYEDDANRFSGTKTSRLARFTVQGDVASSSSEFVILGHWVGAGCDAFPVGFDCIPSDGFSHSVGNVKFAPDGTLFLTSGDAASFSTVDPLALRAQNLDSLGGKLMHIDRNGNGLASNPFYSGDVTANRAKIYDYGLRNPFRFNFRPGSNVPYIGQVGWNSWEDIYVGQPGRNFGWPCYEGNFIQDGYSAYPTCQALYGQSGARTAPFLSYQHSGGSTSITAGFFYTGTNFPAQYQGRFFYGDYGHGWIRTLQADANDVLVPGSVTDFVAELGADGPVAIDQGPDGFLYYVAINTQQFRRIRYIDPNSPPTAAAAATPSNGLLPLNVQFSSAGTSDPNNRPLTYLWNFGDGATSTAANPSHTYSTAGVYNASLTVTNNVPTSANATVKVTAGSRPPTASITTPSSSLLYRVGQNINFSGTGTDYNGSALPASALSWEIIVHHCPQGSCHLHHLETVQGAGGVLTVPDHGDNVFLELQLTVVNSFGLSDTQTVSINPQLVTLTFDTVPTGLQVVYDGSVATTPRTQVTVINSAHTLFAPSPQQLNQATFGSWSDGGAAQHSILVGASPTTYTATFNTNPPANQSLALDQASWVDTLSQVPLNIIGDWTLESWFKDENPAGYNHDFAYIAMKGDSNAAGEAPYLMGIGWRTIFAGQRTGYSTSMVSYDLQAGGVSANAWHHAAAVYVASSSTLTLFIDGNQVAAGVISHTSEGNSLPLSIGRNGSTGNYWRGKLDDIRVWNVARSGANIRSTLNTQYIGAPTGLVGNWRFDEGSGASVNDMAGLATGTLKGNAVRSADVHGGTPPPNTPTPTPTATPIPGTPTSTPTPIVGAVTINFDSLTPNNVMLNGQYPAGVANWGTNLWFLSGPYGAFTTNSVGFNGAGPTSAPITFVSPKRLVQVEAFNGGGVSSTVSAACTGQTTAQMVLAAGQRGTLVTNFTATCSSTTLGSTNGWDTNFDNLLLDDGPSGPGATPTPTATATRTPTMTPTTGVPTNTPTATPTSQPGSCPCSIFGPTSAPATTTTGMPVELGVKFRSDVGGTITGVRFYKPSTETGAHIVNLWSATGTLLASGNSSGETSSGWQQVSLLSPVTIAANTTYVASYHSNGRFGYTLNAFSTAGVDNAPLHALMNGADGANGVYMYGATSVFPTTNFQASNYFVDVAFNPSGPPATNTPTSTPTPTRTPTRTPTPTPLPPTNTPTATSTPVGNCPCTIWPTTAAPVLAANPDTRAVEVGVKFRVDQPGRITGIRFYKASTNTGAHTGTLWSVTGQQLATGTFTGETASGWQQLTFATPVVVAAGTTYVASYHTNVGRYAADQAYFATSGVDNPPLHALQTGIDGGQGVYTYGSTTAFPTSTFNATNYWVDVVYSP